MAHQWFDFGTVIAQVKDATSGQVETGGERQSSTVSEIKKGNVMLNTIKFQQNFSNQVSSGDAEKDFEKDVVMITNQIHADFGVILNGLGVEEVIAPRS